MSVKFLDNVKREYIVLLIIIVALASYLLKKDSDRTEIKLPELKRVESKNIKKISVENPKGKFTIVKKEKKWNLETDGFPVNEGKVEKMVNLLSDTDISDLISKTGMYDRYGLGDKTKTKVMAFGDKGKLRELEIGNGAESGNRTFVKLKDDKNVYQARGDFKNSFDIEKGKIVDKKIFVFYNADITEMIINREGDKYHFLKVDEAELNKTDKNANENKAKTKSEKKMIWVNADKKNRVNSKAIDSYISDNASIHCDSYIQDKIKNDENKSLEIVFIDKTKRRYKINLYGDLSDLKNIKRVKATSPERDFSFYLTKDSVEKLVKDFIGFENVKSENKKKKS